MLYHEVLERATTEDIAMFVAHKHLSHIEQKRQDKRNAARAKNRRR